MEANPSPSLSIESYTIQNLDIYAFQSFPFATRYGPHTLSNLQIFALSSASKQRRKKKCTDRIFRIICPPDKMKTNVFNMSIMIEIKSQC